jgi:hypothetical protein
MPQTLEATAGVAFELDRFEHADGGGLEVDGRWFGVRGRRFVRPTLTALASGERVRLLADIAGKPWAAQDGEVWRAAFPCELESWQLSDVELTVAPDIAISLPDFGGDGSRRSRRPRAGDGELASLRREARDLRDQLAQATDAARLAAAERDRAIHAAKRAESDRERVGQAVARAQAERQNLTAELARTQSKLTEASGQRDRATSQINALRSDLARLTAAATAASREPVISPERLAPMPVAPNWRHRFHDRHEFSPLQRVLAVTLLFAAIIAFAAITHMI